MKKKSKLLFQGNEWDIATISRIYEECEKIAVNEMGLSFYPSVFYVTTSEQMLDAYSRVGMPTGYNHWSFGKSFARDEYNYRKGNSGLAFEIVLNTNPCINYIMEGNSATIQALVIAHAAFGHSSFFKNNYLFKELGMADSIVDYLAFAKKFISDCEEKYGLSEVESVLDSAHALEQQGIDKTKKKVFNLAEETARRLAKEDYLLSTVDVVMDSTLPLAPKLKEEKYKKFPVDTEENILKFIEKHSPSLAPWKREIIRIVRTIATYFNGQSKTKVLNEGMATYTHMYILGRLYEKGLINEGSMLEVADVQASVVRQGNFNQVGPNFNPYALGLAILRDIERICTKPDDEDHEWFPTIAGKGNHFGVIRDIVANYNDESGIRQFLGPKVIRDFKMFLIEDLDSESYIVNQIHDKKGYKEIRSALADRYDRSRNDPDIQVYSANLDDDRVLELHYMSKDGSELHEKDTIAVLYHVRNLWGFNVEISTYMDGEKVSTVSTDPIEL